MLKFPPELIVHRGSVVYLLYVVGGLLMTVTAGSRCVDVAVRTAQDPAKLLRLSNALITLMGLRDQKRVKNSLAKRKLKKRLYFTESLNSLLDAIRAAQHRSQEFPGSPEKQVNLESTCSNCVSVRRSRICYILFRGVRSWSVLTLCTGDDCSELKTYNPSDQLRWLVDFSRTAQGRGHVITLLVGGQAARIGAEPQRHDDSNERGPSRLSLVSSALCVVLLWMILPHIALCVIVLFSWTMQGHMRRAVLS
ncbi:uncharacterized protein LOC117752069 isoform X1 [Hippoglossus hippoglossus]|uniref:uncharacterized protein LOC117752069 isoform X1 n=1 Tax=Hippoglossus hippoglossus TaxID=8267 RepID=UPI00148DD85F|nr:uncharacterized protein LOC117752069 isoform X1 [Hippoglossus hippoglossus]